MYFVPNSRNVMNIEVELNNSVEENITIPMVNIAFKIEYLNENPEMKVVGFTRYL